MATDPAAHATRRRLSPAERTAELIDAAERLVLDDGPAALSLERVAEDAGCSRNLAYTYFPNQAALLEAMRARQRDRLATAVLERIPRPSDLDPWITAWVDLVLDEAEERGPLLLLLFEGGGTERRRAMSRGTVAGMEAKLTGLGLPRARARVVARLISGAILAAAVAVVVDGCPRRQVQDELMAMILPLPRPSRP